MKIYGKSVSQGLTEQRTVDAMVGVLLDAQKHCPNASPGTVRKWRRQIERRDQNEKVNALRG